MSNLRLPFEPDAPAPADTPQERDRAARARAVDPRFNVALEASAGTGKTRVLVDRYINLLRAGVDPANILAMTFTRKAATEMRDRILHTLRTAAERGEITPVRWREIQERSGDIAISTIDAFCLSLLREFPLEADLDPGFSVADDTEVPRLVDEALDRALRICRALAREDERVALVFAQLGERRARSGLASLLARRVVAPGILSRFLARGRRDLTAADAAGRAARELLELLSAMAPADDDDAGAGLRRFVMSGPADPAFMLFIGQLERLDEAVRVGHSPDPRQVHSTFARAREYFLRRDGEPRSKLAHPKAAFASESAWRIHRELVAASAPGFSRLLRTYRHDINVLVAGGVWRMFRVAEAEYRRTLDAHAVLDFSDLLLQTLVLLRRMEEFARSRYRLESRYHHVLVDEFQDTSRAQWELVSLLVQSWGEGAGLAHAGPLSPSIFIVGDRKQSIYGFRDADVSVLGDAVRFLAGLRTDSDVRRSISRSFRSVAPLLAFVNDVCHDMDKVTGRADAFEYGEDDRFPIDDSTPLAGRVPPPPDPAAPPPVGRVLLDPATNDPALGLVLGDTSESCAEATAAEIVRLIESETIVRDSSTGLRRPVRAGDVAILFRTRESHRAFEDALQRRGVASYVYKGLGFFDTDEIRDMVALLGFLAQPDSHLRAAALLRSGVVRLSDAGLQRLAPDLAGALRHHDEPVPSKPLDGTDARALAFARAACRSWLTLVDRIPPAELLDRVSSESAYAVESRGARTRQARENLKKLRGLVRRIQNNGYATLDRIVRHLDRLAVGDESNAAIDAVDAVNLMTVHAAKGLEFPVVFVVNLTRGTGGHRSAIRVTSLADEEVSVSVGDYRSASDDDEAAVEREETKRLLYVALTRARDRLYVGATLKDGRLQAARGSLGEVLPASLLACFAAATTDAVSWTSSSGSMHTFRMVREAAASVVVRESVAGVAEGNGLPSGQAPVDFASLGRPEVRRALAVDASTPAEDETPGESRLLGTLVHRLVHRFGFGAADDARLTEYARQLIRPEEAAVVVDMAHVTGAAADYYLRLCSRPDVRALYDAGQPLFEVPFSSVRGGRRARGVIDCLVGRPLPGNPSKIEHLTVVELKTGTPRPEHREQVALYRDAASAVFPGASIETALIYSGHIERF